MNSSHCSPTRMWHTYAHIHTEVQIWVKVPQRLLSATVDTQTPAGPESLAGRPGVSVTHCPIPCTQPSLGVPLGHTISRDCNGDTARRSDTSLSCGVLVTTSAQQTERKSSVTHTLLAASEPLRK